MYTLDHPELAPLKEVARFLDTRIGDTVGSLLVPTTRRVHWARTTRTFGDAAAVEATLVAAGWIVDPSDVDDPLCDTQRVASELGIASTTARRWMRDGTLNCVILKDANQPPTRLVRLSDVWALRDRLAGRILLPDLATQLGIRYHELYRMSRRMGMDLGQHPTGRQFEVPHEDADRLRAEHGRVRALHERSIKVAAAARQLGLAVSTIKLMAKRGELDTDPETDSSNARFVTRASVEKHRIAQLDNSPTTTSEQTAVPLADVIRFTGRSRTELLDLVRAGILEEAPAGRGPCRLTAESLRAWMTASLIPMADSPLDDRSCAMIVFLR